MSGIIYASDKEKIKKLKIEWKWEYETGSTDEEIASNDILDTKDAQKIQDYKFVIDVSGELIVVAFVLTIILSTISLGKYFNKTKINVNSGVAIPIIKLEGEQKLIINNNQENKVYNLAVKNYDENEQITQVELEYYIEIISKRNDDINFKIYKEEKELNINNNKTEKFLLTKENKQQDNYKIEILLNKKMSENILQNIEIKVCSEQKNEEEVKE